MKKASVSLSVIIAVIIIFVFGIFPATGLYWVKEDMGVLNGSANASVYALVPRTAQLSEKGTDFRMSVLNKSVDFYYANGFANYSESPQITDIKYGYNKVRYILNDPNGGAQWLVSVRYGFGKEEVDCEILKQKNYSVPELTALNTMIESNSLKMEVSMSDTYAVTMDKYSRNGTVSDNLIISSITSAIDTCDKTQIESRVNEDYNFKCVIKNDNKNDEITLLIWKDAISINGTTYTIDTNTYNIIFTNALKALAK